MNFSQSFSRFICALVMTLCAALLAACASGPPVPDWQLNAKAASEQALAAYLSGNTRLETLAWERTRKELARTGQPLQLARAELLRCASRVASLVFEPCTAFEALRADVSEAERDYAAYLAAKGTSALPSDTALAAISDPLSRLVAAGVLLQSGKASPTVLQLAVDTASAQGWSRPLLAWLQVQAGRAEQAGEQELAQRLRRRMALVAPTLSAR